MSEGLVTELGRAVRGGFAADAMSRALYATDASIYQVLPQAVVTPLDAEDVAAALRAARRHGASVTARGGGTSLAGQAVGAGVQLDFSRHMRRVLELSVAERWAWVEPGMVLDVLNGELAQHGLKFAPDVSPANRATIGGMIANNSSGMYSIVYGKTLDHVLELRVMLADGSVAHLRPLDAEELREKLTGDSLESRIYRTVRRLGREQAEEVGRRFPKVLRRVGGYNLDRFTGEGFNLSDLIVGSEGTLAIILAAKLRLVPRPAHTAIGILAFDSLDDALDAVVPCLERRPAAVELFDEILLDLTRRSAEYSQHLAKFVRGEPRALLQVEFFGETLAEADGQLDELERHLRERHAIAAPMTRALTPELKRSVLEVRKAGLPLLQSLSPDLRPETFVEDSAVPPERLAEYIRRFRAVCEGQGVRVAFYGHASVGLMHARPLINLKRAEDVRTMRTIAEAICDLVIEFGGALSGEHGDGMLRGEFNRRLFGETLYEAFREIKRTCDPHGLLNPGKIIDAPPMDTQLRYGGGYRVTIPLETHFRFADTGGLAGAVELCNGNGLCRKTGGGTMCPSYMATRDEEHSTRGRANALRMVLSGALPPEELVGERMREVMDLCLECKGCTGECPSRVNMTRIKSEWLSRYYDAHGVPLRARFFASIRRISQVGSALAPLANAALRLPLTRLLQERLLGVSRHRQIPGFAAEPFHRWHRRRARASSAARAVVLFPDTFSDYSEPGVARAAVRVLEAAGYRVLLPQRRVCCGRPMISKGLLGEARALLRQQLDALAPYVDAGLPIVGLEPSCILTFRDELPDLVDDPRAAALAGRALLLEEFLARELRDGACELPLRAPGGAAQTRYLLHGHCHQKALAGTGAALELLRRIPGAEVREVDSGCCGMAGSFGYEAEHYAISQAIGERALLPAVRALPPEGRVVAIGSSCRQQIAGGAGRHALHLAEALAEALP